MTINDNGPVTAPRQEYAGRLAAHQATVSVEARADALAAWLRLATFGIFLLVAWLAWSERAAWWWLTAPAVTFLALVKWHDRVIARHDRAQKLVAFYQRGLERLSDRWPGSGPSGDRFADPHHPYAADLDLFGRGSLFDLLCLARTRAGEETLAAWLTHPASPDTIHERQETVTELARKLDLRERVWSAGADVATEVHPDTLVAWAESPAHLPRWLQIAAAALTAAVIGAAILAWSTGTYTLLLVVLAVEGAVLYRYLERVGTVLHTAAGWSRDLDVMARVTACVEGELFTSPVLVALSARLASGGMPPSAAISRLHRLSEMHDWQHNVLFAAVAVPLLWGVHVALAMERWRRIHGGRVRVWLDAIGEFEALDSLAAYRYERTDDVFPEVRDEGGAAFVGESLGHPLLPAHAMVRNDVRLGDGLHLLVVSGSNMSGKSTLLRTVGVNAVLAQMGAPVRASALRMSPLAPGATLRVQDSLQEGRSRFYAEITRLKDIADRSRQQPPTLFLLDELFHGTNSHDRLTGAAGVLGALVDRGAIGLVTTHDMALVAVADGFGEKARNVHFEDHFEDGEIRFDYRMKPGPVTRSNAIALMRAVGLDVDRP